MFTRKSLELMIDLVEIKIGNLEAADVEDRRTLIELERCRKELITLSRPKAHVIAAQSVAAQAVAAQAAAH